MINVEMKVTMIKTIIITITDENQPLPTAVENGKHSQPHQPASTFAELVFDDNIQSVSPPHLLLEVGWWNKPTMRL